MSRTLSSSLSTSTLPRRTNTRKRGRNCRSVSHFARSLCKSYVHADCPVKDKYGSDYEEGDEDEDSEEGVTEDEDGEELTPAVDAAILRTLARIKRKDPAIYEQGKDVFEGALILFLLLCSNSDNLEEVKKTGDAKLSSRTTKDKVHGLPCYSLQYLSHCTSPQSKPLTIKQQNLQAALNGEDRSPSPEPLTHVKEQKALRDETIAAFHTAVDEAESDDDLLVPREKTKDELEREEEEYQEFLKREVGENLNELITVEEEASAFIAEDAEEGKGTRKEKKAKKAKDKTGKSKVEEDHEFLMKYANMPVLCADYS